LNSHLRPRSASWRCGRCASPRTSTAAASDRGRDSSTPRSPHGESAVGTSSMKATTRMTDPKKKITLPSALSLKTSHFSGQKGVGKGQKGTEGTDGGHGPGSVSGGGDPVPRCGSTSPGGSKRQLRVSLSLKRNPLFLARSPVKQAVPGSVEGTEKGQKGSEGIRRSGAELGR
jgi:hypothetical protein